MEVRAGYKQTEVGVIPEDWDAMQIGQIGNFKNGINKPKEAFGSGYPFVNLMDVFGVSAIRADAELGYLQTTPAERASYDLRAGDVLFVRSSVKPSGVGLTTLVEEDLTDTVYSGFLLRFRDSGRLNPFFKKHCFHDFRFRASLISSSTVSANTNVSQSTLKSLWMAVPRSFDEQAAIAEALSDADALIASLDALIAKKRDIKQATMQQLLTGKTRLPGFGGEWAPRALSDGIQLLSGQHVLAVDCNDEGNGVPYITGPADFPAGIVQHTKFTERPTTICQPNDILLTVKGSGTGALVLADKSYCISRQLMAIRSAVWDFNYIYWSIVNSVRSLESTTSGMIPGLSRQDVRRLSISLPLERKEQEAISSVITDMDDEITSLEARRDKARAIKKGMMQELLAGRIRLV